MRKYRNYIILGAIAIITITCCIYALKWHAIYIKESGKVAIITNYIHELKETEFNNYISENPYTVIYYGATGDNNCRLFEEKFKNYIVDNNLRQLIVYVNVNNDLDFGKVPAIAVYNHTALVEFVADRDLSIDRVKKILAKYNFNGE